LVSVIIPVYNAQATISACLNALLNAGYENLEVICIDDGSLDCGPTIIESYCARFSFIRLIREKRGGPARARNIAARAARGKYFFFVDSDIFVTPREIDILLDCLGDPAVGCAGGRVVPFSLSNRFERFENWRYLQLFGANDGYVDYLPISNLLIPREVFSRVGEFDERYSFASEDCDFGRRMNESGFKMLHCSRATARHVHSHNRAELLRRAFAYGEGEALLSAKYGKSVAQQLRSAAAFFVLMLPLVIQFPFLLWDLALKYYFRYNLGRINGIRTCLVRRGKVTAFAGRAV
jgi:glycosyltransferase involved in cell wall biosynthesis